MSLLIVAVGLGAAGCGSPKPNPIGIVHPCSGAGVVGCTPPTTPTPSPTPAPSPTGCQQVSTLLNEEQSTIQGLQSGSVSEVTAESTVTGTNGILAQDQQEAGSNSILGVTLEQLVSENGLFSEALDQSVPVSNLGVLFNTVNQDIANVRTNCRI